MKTNSTYEVFVAARNDEGTGAWSEAGTVRTPTGNSPPPPAVSLSASPNPVTEGSQVTVMATLSQALKGDVTIPLSTTRDTAETGDYGGLASITVAALAITGTGTVTANQDNDSDDETFTVALGTLPAEAAEGTPPSVTITILDDDEPRDDDPPVVQPPSGGGGGGGGRGVCDRVDLVVENLEVEEPEEKTSVRVRLPYNEPPFDTSTIIRCAAVSIKYTTEDGSALSGKDYEASSGEIELLGAGGRTEGYGEAILEIPIVDDPLYEPDEAFTLKLEVDPSENRGWSRSDLPTVDDDGYPVTIHSDDPPSSYVPAEPQPAWEYVE